MCLVNCTVIMEPEPEHHYLYFWDMEITKGVVGHIALNVWFPKQHDYIYISHWPEQRTFMKGQKGQKNQMTLLDDIIAEGNRNPEILQIPFDFLVSTDIDRWLGIDTKDPEKPYHLKNWNCAHVVCKALQIGLGARNLQLELEYKFMGPIKLFPLTPESLFSWMQNKVQVDKLQIKAQDSGATPLNMCDPQQPIENFSGRSNNFLNVCTALKSSEQALVVIAGTGGVGKTEFARKVAHELSSSFENRVFWMDSETKEGLQKCLFDLATRLEILHLHKTMPKMTESETRKLFHDIYSHFSTKNQNSLFIFDKVSQFKSSSSSNSSSKADESVFLVSKFLPNSFPDTKFSPFSAILITSRSSDWSESKDFQVINLQNFNLIETTEYFRNTFREISEAGLEECKREIELLHEQLDGYTLGLTLAAGWIRGAGFKVNSRKLKEGLTCYLRFFRRPSHILCKKKPKGTSSTSLDTNYKYNPHEILEQTCAAIGKENPLALTLLKQMSFLSAEYLTVVDCVFLNGRYNLEPINLALNTLSNFNIVSILDSGSGSGVCFDGSSSIKIHQIFKLLIKNGQLDGKCRDASILFQICDRVMPGGKYDESYTVFPHLLSLQSSLRQFVPRHTCWSFVKQYFWVVQLIMWWLTKDIRWITEIQPGVYDDPRDPYLHSCHRAISNSGETEQSVLMKIDKKLQNLVYRINPESVMDNSDILNDSESLYKIMYQELADFMFQQLVEKPEYLKHGIQLKILKVLESLGVWPHKHMDEAVIWLKNQHDDHWFKNSVLVLCLKNPNLTCSQRQELELVQLKFELITLKMQLVNDGKGENWLNILQYDRTLHRQPFVLTDDDKIGFLQKGIKVCIMACDDQPDDIRKHKLFLKVIQAKLKKVDGQGEHLIGKRLVEYLLADATLTTISSSENMQRFTEMFLLFLPFPHLFSQEDLDNRFSLASISSSTPGSFYQVMCSVFTTISIMSVMKSKDVSHKYSKKLREDLKPEHFNQITSSCSPKERKMWNGFLPHFRSFVKQNQDSEHKETKELVEMIQFWIFTLKHRRGTPRVFPVLVGVGVCAIGIFGCLWFSCKRGLILKPQGEIKVFPRFR